MTDLIAKLDALAADPSKGFIAVLVVSYPALRAELLAARELADALEGYRSHRAPSTAEILWAKQDAYRAARGEGAK